MQLAWPTLFTKTLQIVNFNPSGQKENFFEMCFGGYKTHFLVKNAFS